MTAPIKLAKRKQKELPLSIFCSTQLLCLNYVLMLVLISFLMSQASLHFFVLPFVFPPRFRGRGFALLSSAVLTLKGQP
jgi:hypothetical protein